MSYLIERPARNREEALKESNDRYFGERCEFGHAPVRYTRTKACVACENHRDTQSASKVDGCPPVGRNPALIREIEHERELKAALAEVWE